MCSVQPCTPKVLPNTETFLHSRVFFVTCVVPALCQIMYSLSVCSDGTTSAAPRSFRQNRPPARTLSLTERPARRKKESERGFGYPSHEEKRRFDEPRQWLAAKQNLARLSSINQQREEEQ